MSTDPAVQTVAEALHRWWNDCTPTHKKTAEPDDDDRSMAEYAVDAYRRHVLSSHPDAERWKSSTGDLRADLTFMLNGLLAALADETAARQAAEADLTEAVQVGENWKAAYEGMAGHRDRLAEQVRRVRERCAALLDGELAHRSRDYGRGVAQATRDILAVLDGAVTRARMADQP